MNLRTSTSILNSYRPVISATMTEHQETRSAYDQVYELFQAIDINTDGELNKTELLQAVTRRRMKEKELDALFQKVSTTFPKLKLLLKAGSVRAALMEMDTDKDGTVNVNELVAFCQVASSNIFQYQPDENDMRPPKAQLEPDDIMLPEDVLAKAERLGIDVAKETHLLWVARQALMTPLPPDWEYSWVADEGRALYHNLITSDKSVSHPANPYFKQMVLSERSKPAPRTAGMDGAWMDFETSAGRTYYYSFTQSRRVVKCPFGVQLLSRPSNVKFSVLDTPSTVLNNTGFSSSQNNATPMRSSFSSSKLLDEAGSESRRRSSEGQQEPGSTTRHIRDLGVLEFKSWWSETVQGMKKGSNRRYMDLLFSCETGQFQVILDRSDKVYTLSHIEGKHGPLEAWDLYVGARINVLGRMTTLMQASGPTLDWLDYHCKRLQKASSSLKRELKKYSMSFAREQSSLMSKSSKGGKGAVSLRKLLNDIDSLRTRLSDYRPKLADDLIKTLLR
jgi:hypothetical protein